MAQAFFGIHPVLLSWPGTSWSDLDLSSYLPEGATGAILRMSNHTGSTYWFGLRGKGSADDYNHPMGGNSQTWILVPVNANRVVEAKAQATAMPLFLIGYTMGSGVTMLMDSVDVTPATKGSWQECDLSAVAPGALAVILFTPVDGAGYQKARAHGSTDEFHDWMTWNPGADGWMVVPCDENQHVDLWADTGFTIRMQGYITKGFVANVNAVDKTVTADGAYHEMTIAAAAVFAFFEAAIDGNEYKYDIAQNGEAVDTDHTSYKTSRYTANPMVPCDSAGKVQGKIEGAGTNFYLRGYAAAYADSTFHPRVILF
jgi:hypothetical protein